MLTLAVADAGIDALLAAVGGATMAAGVAALEGAGSMGSGDGALGAREQPEPPKKTASATPTSQGIPAR